MLWVLIFLLVFVCGNTFAAFNPMPLCDGGYPMAVATDDGFTYTCVQYEQNTCVSDYVAVNVLGLGPSYMDGSCSDTMIAVDVDFYVNNRTKKLCDAGYPEMVATDDGFTYTCVQYEQNTCVSDYVAVNVLGLGPSYMDGSCSDTMIAVGVDFYVNNRKPNLCKSGFYDGGKCVEYVPDSSVCPQTYNKITDDMALRVVDDDVECPTQFFEITAFDDSHSDNDQITVWRYPYDTVPDSMLTLHLCPPGQEMNYLGNCVNLCPWKMGDLQMRYLRTSTGLIMPIYASKVTMPSLNVKAGNTQCYINLLPGNQTGTLNFKAGEQAWHVVD